MSSAKVIIITEKEFNEMFADKVGTLMFPDDLWDCMGYVDCKKMRSELKNDLPRGAKIKKVLIHNEPSAGYKNIKNTKIPYAYRLCCSETHDGAFRDKQLGMWLCNYPVGDAIVVIK